MSVTAVLVVFATIWFLALFVVLPIGIRTQGDTGVIEPGTPASAPIDAMLRKKLLWATIAAVLIAGPLCAFIITSGMTMHDIDFWGVM